MNILEFALLRAGFTPEELGLPDDALADSLYLQDAGPEVPEAPKPEEETKQKAAGAGA